MTKDAIQKTTLDEVTVDITFAPIEALLKPEPVKTMGGTLDGLAPLAHSWHFLQVYCGWGLRLPSDDTDLQLLLNTTELGAFKFYPSMKEGATRIKSECRSFMSETLPKMVQVGSDLANFAQSASNDDGAMFKLIIEMLDGDKADPDSALALINSLKDDAQIAIDRTNTVQKELGAFRSGLTEGSAKIEAAKERIEEDSKTNLKKMKQLSSNDPNVAGSLASLENARTAVEDLYKHDVVVAATSPTYAWVFPVGTISAVVVAAVFGVRAVEALENLEKAKEAVRKANDELHRAVTANATYTVANSAATKILQYTDRAMGTITDVQNGWNDVLKSLSNVATEISRTTKITDEGEKLMKTELVKKFLERCETKWRALAPTLTLLTQHPYVTFEPKPQTPAEAAKEVRAELDKAA